MKGLAVPFLFAFGFLAAPLWAQGRGDYLNFESPQVKPIAVADVDGFPFLLVCNTPDNVIEVFDITAIENGGAGTMAIDHGRVARIPVGLEPVSVVYHAFAAPDLNMMYTANWLSDSVSYVRLSAPGGIFGYTVFGAVDLRGNDVQGATRPGDEPMHVAVIDQPGSQHLLVTKRGGSSISWLNPFNGNARAVNGTAGGGQDVILTDAGMFEWNEASPTTPTGSMAIKEPHTILATDTGFWVLGHQGGGSERSLLQVPTTFELDLWYVDFVDPAAPFVATVGGTVGGTDFNLGTTNFNMDFNEDFTSLYVVSTQARNATEGNAALSTMPTGFVTTLLHKLTVSTPQVGPPASPPQVTGKRTRDLNLQTLKVGTPSGGPGLPVNPRTRGLGHVTDVEVYRGEVVAVTSFNSDRFALVDTTRANPRKWRLGYADIPAVSGGPNDVSGPRGLAIHRGSSVEDDPGDRVYLLNRLDNSVTVIDPDPDGTLATLDPVVVDSFSLTFDPVPAEVRAGQKFLYSTRFSGTNGVAGGFVSCASCHIDGRSDQQQWELTPEDGIPLPFLPVVNPSMPANPLVSVPEINGSNPNQVDAICAMISMGYPSPKGPKITQSLQGLLNWDVEGEPFELLSNAPYHWRGDKARFTRFNEAFVGLQGMPELFPGNPDPQGISDADMLLYETFINSLHYPPNPLQRRDRTYREGNSEASALRGLDLFHTVDTPELARCGGGTIGTGMAGRSCVQCHFLPEGSNNRVTSRIGGQPIETAALRGMRQKEARLELDATVFEICAPQLSDLRTGDFGLGNEGETGLTLQGFHQLLAVDDNNAATTTNQVLTDITAYIREFDTGVAPVVGWTINVLAGQDRSVDINELEGQAKEANCGIAVYLRDDALERGFWYSVSEDGYREAETTGALLSRPDLLNLPGWDVLVFQATPLGSERRVAALTTPTATGPVLGTPSVTLVSTSPNTANAPILGFTAHFDDDILLDGGTCDPTTSPFELPTLPHSLETLKDLQQHLQRLTPGQQMPTSVRHDAPRRIQVTGSNLQQGCKLHLGIDMNPNTPPGSALPSDFETLVLPLYPTDEFLGPDRLWETAVEFDPLTLYTLLLGGPAAPGIAQAYQNQTNFGAFRPAAWNLYQVEVVNPDTSRSGITLQPLEY